MRDRGDHMQSPISAEHAERMFKALEAAIPILARVVADNLMPDIAAPAYPSQVLTGIEELVEEILKDRVQYGPALVDRIKSARAILREIEKA